MGADKGFVICGTNKNEYYEMPIVIYKLTEDDH